MSPAKAVRVELVSQYFESLSDPRNTKNRKHKLTDLIVTRCPKCGWQFRTLIRKEIKVRCFGCSSVITIEPTGEIRQVGVQPARVVAIQVSIPNSQAIVDLKQQGRNAWAALHQMTSPTIEKIAKWLQSVPSINCTCREFARKYVKDNPPPCEDEDAFFVWGWQFHDTVDQKTGDTPRMTLTEARRFWNRPKSAGNILQSTLTAPLSTS